MSARNLENRVGKLEKTLSAFSQELRLALRYVQPDAASSLTKSRVVLEKLLIGVFTAEMAQPPRKPLLGDMLVDNQFTRKIERRILSRMNAIRDMGNLGPHGEPVESSDAARVLDDLCEVLDWYLLRYAEKSAAAPAGQDKALADPPTLPVPSSGSGRKVGIWAAVTLAGLVLLGVIWKGFFPAEQTNTDTTKAADLARKQDNPQPPAPKQDNPQPAVPKRQPNPGEVRTVALGPGVEMKLAWVPPGDSWLGGGNGTPGTKKFTLNDGLWCGVYPVTQAEWQAVTGKNPSQFKDHPRYPVESVSWNRVQDFIKELNQRNRDEGLLYRLPTEWEWEYICRGGPLSQDQSKYHFYFARTKSDLTPAPSNDLCSKQANFNGEHPAGSAAKGKYLARPCDVGLYLPNPLGIYDLHGNVWEWTSSLYDAGGSARVMRGGSWYNDGANCSASRRNWGGPGFADSSVGFRLLAVPTR